MKIQFVCNGNTFRSRLAEAYLLSKNIPGLVVSSSGIHAGLNLNGPIAPYTPIVANKFKIAEFLTDHWTESTKKDIEEQDLVIFMEPFYYNFCRDELNCILKHYKIWNINDIPEKLLNQVPRNPDEILVAAELEFKKMVENIDLLLGSTELAEIMSFVK